MNEQRKIIYRRRQQILDGEDLQEQSMEAVSGAVVRLVDRFCPGEFVEEWDVGELMHALGEYFPVRLTEDDDRAAPRTASASKRCCKTEAIELYERARADRQADSRATTTRGARSNGA